MGRPVSASKDYRQAITWILEGVKYAETFGLSYDTAKDYVTLSDIHHRLNESDAAFRNAARALEIATASGNPYDLGLAHGALAKVHFQRGDASQASASVQNSLSYFGSIGARRRIEAILKGLEQALAKVSDHDTRGEIARAIARARETLATIPAVGGEGERTLEGRVLLRGP